MFSDYVRKSKAFFFRHIERPLSEIRKNSGTNMKPKSRYSTHCIFFFWSLFSRCCHHWDSTELSTSSGTLSLLLSWENERLHTSTKSVSSLNSFPRKMPFCKIAKHLRYVTGPTAEVCRVECSTVLTLTWTSCVILAKSLGSFLLGLSPSFGCNIF